MSEPYSTRIARDLHMVAALTRRVLEQGTQDDQCEVSFAQLTVLAWLALSPSRKAGDVARYLSTSAPAATQMLARLKEKGLVRAVPNPRDRRTEDLTVTPRARGLIESQRRTMLRRVERVLESESEATCRGIAQGLESAIELLLRTDPQIAMCLHCGAHSSPGCVMRKHGKRCPTEEIAPAPDAAARDRAAPARASATARSRRKKR